MPLWWPLSYITLGIVLGAKALLDPGLDIIEALAAGALLAQGRRDLRTWRRSPVGGRDPG